MDKIRALLEKVGISQEAANQICESLETHLRTTRDSLQEEFTKRTETAKRVCVEETEQHKLELARRLQVWCEAMSTKIEKIVAKQAQAREGQATITLESIKSMLEGVSISDESGLKEKVLALEDKVKKLTTERNQAVTKANRQNEMSEKILSRNRIVETKLARLEAEHGGTSTVLGESRPQRTNGGGQRTQRLDGGRSGGQPATTRRTLTENNDRRDPNDNRRGNVRHQSENGNGGTGPTPAEIAANMPDIP